MTDICVGRCLAGSGARPCSGHTHGDQNQRAPPAAPTSLYCNTATCTPPAAPRQSQRWWPSGCAGGGRPARARPTSGRGPAAACAAAAWASASGRATRGCRRHRGCLQHSRLTQLSRHITLSRHIVHIHHAGMGYGFKAGTLFKPTGTCVQVRILQVWRQAVQGVAQLRTAWRVAATQCCMTSALGQCQIWLHVEQSQELKHSPKASKAKRCKADIGDRSSLLTHLGQRLQHRVGHATWQTALQASCM